MTKIVKLPKTKSIFKDDAVLKICKGKTVLHIGATDSPFHVSRAKCGMLLHQKLQKVAKQLVGIDFDTSAIDDLNQFNITNIFQGDIVKGVFSKKVKGQFDVIVMGDVIEHLGNPGVALSNIKQFMAERSLLIVTCPNLHCLHTYKSIFSGKEDVHPDHTYWPSYVTMSKLLNSEGYKVKKFNYCMWGSRADFKGVKAAVYGILLRWKPFLSSAMFFQLTLQTL